MSDDGSLVEDVLPLSPLQQGLLFHALFDEDAQDIYTMRSLVEIEGPLRPELLRTAVEELFARHANLRSAFLHEELDEPVQVVLKQITVDWTEADAAQEAALVADATARFALTDPPLLRFTLVDRGENRWLLILTNHHLLLDGWSVPLLVRELLQLYAARLAPDRAAPLPAVRPYRDFLAWLAARDREASGQAWRQALAGATPTLLAPTAPGPVPVRPELHTLRLPASTKELARSHGVTVNTVVQGLWALLLARLTGREDVVFGATVAGRPAELAGAEAMIGLFINTVPVRVAVPPGERAGAFLRRLQHEQARLMDHQHLGLTEIQRLAGSGDLFDTLLVFENYPIDRGAVAEAEALAGLRIVDVKGSGATHYPLTLAVLDEQHLEVIFEFRPDAYDRATVEALAGRFERLMHAVVAAPDTPLAALDVLVPEERAALLAGGVGERLPSARATMPAVFESQVARTPDAVAVVGAGRRLTFAELNTRANQLARLLVESGAGPERIVAFALPPTPDTMIAILAIQKAGAAYLPLDPAWPWERIAGMLADARPVALLATAETALESALLLDDPAIRQRLAETDGSDLTEEDRLSPLLPEHPAHVIYTSGSTGRPKAVVVPQRAIANLFAAHNATLHTPASDAVGGRPLRVGHAWPTAFDASWQPMLWMFAGHELHFVPEDVRRDQDALRGFLTGHGIEFIELSPSLLGELVAQGGDWQGKLKVLGVGGEAVPPDLWRTLRETDGLAAHNLYGPTECTVDSADCDLALSERPAIGRPVAGGTLYILDGHLNPVPIGVDGELYIAGAGLARGYLGQPGATASRFVADPFGDRPGARMYRTGDIARWTEDGLVECLGRIDDQVKIRGYRIEPGEIEAVLLEHELVERAAVVVREDTPGVRRLVAYVVLKADVTEDALRRFTAAALPDYMVPSAFVPVDGFPLTLNGKLDTAALPAPSRSAGPAAAPPRNAAEQRLATLFAGVLGLDTIGVHDSFFALGGDSIVSMRLVSQARAAGLAVSPRDIFEAPTVAELAERTGSAVERPVSDPDAGTGDIPLTPMLTWLTEQGGPFRQVSQARFLRTPAGTDLDRLHRTVQAVLDRHDLLRATFTQTDAGAWRLHTAPAGAVRAEECVRRRGYGEQPDLAAAFDELVTELDPATGAVARFLWFDAGPDREGRLLVVLHHLVTDAASWGVLVADLAAAWEGRELSPRGTSFKEWARALHEEAPRRTAELALWKGILDRPEPPLGAAPLDPALDTRAMVRRHWTDHPAPTTDVQDVLLEALARAVPAWRREAARPTQDDSVLIALEGHGREERLLPGADLSSTLGWFTTVVPVRLESGRRLPELPDKGIGYGLLRHLDPATAAELAELPQPQIEFNYLGRMTMGERQDSALFTSAPETRAMGSAADPSMPAPYPLVIDAVITDGVLKVCWQWPERLFTEAEIGRLAELWGASLDLLPKGGHQ
ncbi:amino acid adenylation domain-containing protein/non-ribosomal peptide synthase protein (TIGR01720 family) [Streptomyces canus]|uniref:amino acid adenylation domain-containing protein n=1 Tax=Streptomyces canus TaxID=58343 RepID=UPI00278653DD|nr:amino acid adenylation domain-containing protein [Streptomyces canus]MDQ0603850.1 amino acid adenylation domain-containing protein/non-ribosomal peptide synthase protein (TIGR01720 family) [Streptomyces canus]